MKASHYDLTLRRRRSRRHECLPWACRRGRGCNRLGAST